MLLLGFSLDVKAHEAAELTPPPFERILMHEIFQLSLF